MGNFGSLKGVMGQWPLTQYITAVGVPDDVQQRWPWNRRSKITSLREVIDGMPEDDDINFADSTWPFVKQFAASPLLHRSCE